MGSSLSRSTATNTRKKYLGVVVPDLSYNGLTALKLARQLFDKHLFDFDGYKLCVICIKTAAEIGEVSMEVNQDDTTKPSETQGAAGTDVASSSSQVVGEVSESNNQDGIEATITDEVGAIVQDDEETKKEIDEFQEWAKKLGPGTITTRTCKGYSNYQEALQAAIDYNPAPIDTLLVGYGAKESIGGLEAMLQLSGCSLVLAKIAGGVTQAAEPPSTDNSAEFPSECV